MVGLAPTNAVAQDLAQDGFREARTVHAALFAIKNGRTEWDKRTVVMVDEAAMLDTRVTGELLAAARQAGPYAVRLNTTTAATPKKTAWLSMCSPATRT